LYVYVFDAANLVSVTVSAGQRSPVWLYFSLCVHMSVCMCNNVHCPQSTVVQ